VFDFVLQGEELDKILPWRRRKLVRRGLELERGPQKADFVIRGEDDKYLDEKTKVLIPSCSKATCMSFS
jgi:hypothetical protein